MNLERVALVLALLWLMTLQHSVAQAFDPFSAAGIDPARVGEHLALDTRFIDQRDRPVRLGD
ncbi:hypothetical protein, partial [Paraburkholderia sp. SIMBA_030]